MSRKSIKDKVKEHFFQNPTAKLRVRQIERQAKTSLPSTIQAVNDLEQERILKHEIIAGMKVFSADRTSENYLLEKTSYNLRLLHQSGLVNHLKQKHHNPAIILFGSYAKGEDTEESDIDIYIETEKPPQIPEFERILGRKIQILAYKNIRKVENKNLANNIINGITLNGSVEVFK
ncbi:nucleotidyltransferase family protein [Nanoarchaeota archaeon]